jgi:hypothetical protein
MQTVHTEEVPPRLGKIIFATIGWSRNKRAALMNRVME